MQRIFDYLKKNEYWVFYFLIVLFGCTPLLWFNNLPIAGEEFYAVNYARWGQIFASAWAPFINFGEPSIIVSFKLQGLFFEILGKVITNYNVVLKLWYILIWVVTGLVYYVFLNNLFQQRVWRGYIFGASLYFLYTPFFLNISPFLMPPHFLFIGLGLLFNWLHSADLSKPLHVKKLLTLAWIFIFVSPVFVNIIYGAALGMAMFLYIVIYALFYRENYRSQIVNIFLVGFSVLVGTLWWAAPLALKLFGGVDSIKDTTGQFSAINLSYGYDVISQFGSWAFRERVWGYNYDYFSYYRLFDSFPLVFIRYIPLALIIFGILRLKDRKDESKKFDIFLVFSTFVFFIFTFLSKGSTGAGGSVFNFLYLNVPPFWVFREPYAKFMPLVAVASGPLIVLGLWHLQDILRNIKYSKYILGGSFILVAVLLGLPYWADRVVWRINDGVVRSFEVQPPSYWQNFSKAWEPKEGYYLVYPSYGHVDYYKWPSGYIGNPYLMYTTAKVLNPHTNYVLNPNLQSLVKRLYSEFLTNPREFKNNADKYNLSGIIFQNDIVPKSYLPLRTWVKQSYNEHLDQQHEQIDVYTFNSYSGPFDLLEKERVATVMYESFYQMSQVESFTPNYYLQQVKSLAAPADYLNAEILVIKGKDRVLNNTEKVRTVALPDVEEDYVLYIPKGYESIVSANSGDTRLSSIPSPLGGVYLENLSGNVDIVFTDLKPVTLDNTWSLMQNINGYEFKSMTGNRLNLDSTISKYTKKVLSYDPSQEYLLTIRGNRSGGKDLDVELLLLNTKLGIVETIYRKDVHDYAGEMTINIPRAENLITLPDTEVYLAISAFAKTSNRRDLSNYIDIGSVNLNQKMDPQAYLIKKSLINSLMSQSAHSSRLPRYFVVNNGLSVVDLSEAHATDVLQFKQSANENWRLVGISDNDYSNVTSNGIRKTVTQFKINLMSFFGVPASNIEFYSNGWSVDSYAGSKVAVIFMPSALSSILTLATFAALLTMSFIYYFKRK